MLTCIKPYSRKLLPTKKKTTLLSMAPKEAVLRRWSSKVPLQRTDDDSSNKVPPAAVHLLHIPRKQWMMTYNEAMASDDTNLEDGFNLAGTNRCPYFAPCFCRRDKVYDRKFPVIVVNNIGALFYN